MKKGFSYFVVVSLVLLGLVTSVAALGYSFYDEDTVTLSQGKSKTYGAYSVSGVNLRAQTNVTDASKTSGGYVTVQYTAKKSGLFGLYSGIGTQAVNIYSSGWVGGTWTNVSTGKYKFVYKVTAGSVTNMGVRMYDY